MTTLETMHENASKYYEEKELEKALEIYKSIIELNPIDEVALSCIMDIYLELNDKFNYYLSRANINISQNKIEYAISDTKKALEEDIDNVDARKKLARLYKITGKNLKAIDEFTRILEVSEEYDVYFELVDSFMREGSIDSAINIAQIGVSYFKDDESMSNMLAQLYFKSNDYKEALKVAKDEFLKTKILLQAEKNEAANDILKKFNVDNLNEDGKRNYYILKAQYAYNTKDYTTALECVENYSKIKGADAISFQMKALIYEELNNDFEAHLNWGFCYKAQGKMDDANVEFSHAYRFNDKNKTVLIELAKIYERNKEKFVAMEYWQKVYDIDKDEEAREILAEFYYSQGDFKRAEELGKEIQKNEENYTGLIDKIMAFFSK